MADFAASWYRIVEAILNKNSDPTAIITQTTPILADNEWLYQFLFHSPYLYRFIESKLIPSKVAYQYFTLNPEELNMFVRRNSLEQVVKIIKEILTEIDNEQRISFLYHFLGSIIQQNIPMIDFDWVREDIKSEFLEAFFLRVIMSLDFLKLEYKAIILPFLDFYLKEKGAIALISKIGENFESCFPYFALFDLLYPFQERILHELLDAMNYVIESGEVGTLKDTIGPILEYFNNAIWIARNSEYRKKLSHFETIAKYKEAFDRRDYYEGLFFNYSQSKAPSPSEDSALSHFICFWMYCFTEFIKIDYSEMVRIYGDDPLNELSNNMVKNANTSKLLWIIAVFWRSFYYSRYKDHHPFKKLYFIASQYRKELLEEILINIIYLSDSFAVPVKIPNALSESLGRIHEITMYEEFKNGIQIHLQDIKSNEISDPNLFFFQPELDLSLIFDRLDFQEFQEFALALLYHMRFQSGSYQLKHNLRTIVFQKFMSNRIDILLELLAVEFDGYQAQYFNYFLTSPRESLEGALKSLVFNSELNEEKEIIARLSLIAEILKQYPELSIDYLKEEFSKASNLFLLTFSIIIKYIFKIHKLNANAKNQLSTAFKLLLRNLYDKESIHNINERAQHIVNRINPYGMIENPESEKFSRKYFDLNIIFSFYNCLFLDGKRIFYHFPKENLPYYEKKNLPKTRISDNALDRYFFPNLSMFSADYSNQQILYEDGQNYAMSTTMNTIPPDVQYKFPISAGNYTIENYFATFRPFTFQVPSEHPKTARTLSFRTNFPIYTQNIYLLMNPLRRYQDFLTNTHARSGKEKQSGEQNNWSFNLNASMQERIYSEDMQRFLINFRWNTNKIRIFDEFDELNEDFIDQLNSRYLSEIAKFAEKCPLYLSENLQSIYIANSPVEKPIKQDFLGLYTRVITELNRLSVKEIIKKFHCSKSTVQRLILHQFTLWSKIFGYFTDTALYYLIRTGPARFSRITLLGQENKFEMIVLLYDALFDSEDVRSEIVRMFESRNEEPQNARIGILKDKQDRESPDTSLTDDLLL